MPNSTPRWTRAAREVTQISAQSTVPIDKNVKQMVTGLRAFGLPTTASCYGHLRNHGTPYPWIEFQVARRSNHHSISRRQLLDAEKTLELLLNCFYKKHSARYEDR